MVQKLLFVVAVAAFGLLMFVAGVLAPEQVKMPVAMAAHWAVAKLPWVSAEQPAKEEVKAAGDAKEEDAPVATETLLLPSPLPAQGRYALQLGMFDSPELAAILLKRVRAAGIEGRRIAVVDRDGKNWWVVAAGNYGQPDEARTARAMVAREVGTEGGMLVILLPAGAAPAASPVVPASAKS